MHCSLSLSFLCFCNSSISFHCWITWICFLLSLQALLYFSLKESWLQNNILSISFLQSKCFLIPSFPSFMPAAIFQPWCVETIFHSLWKPKPGVNQAEALLLSSVGVIQDTKNRDAVTVCVLTCSQEMPSLKFSWGDLVLPAELWLMVKLVELTAIPTERAERL